MTWAHGLGAALLFLGSTAAGFALRRELQQRAQLLAAVIDSLQLLRNTPPSQTASRTATGRFASNGRRRSGHWTCSHRPRAPRC